MNTSSTHAKKQMLIFIGIAFALPFAMGILMGIGYNLGIDISVFPTAQMLYPAAGAILAALLTRKGDALLPRRFFIGFVALTALLLLCAVASIATPTIEWDIISQYLLIAGSVLLWVLLLTEKRNKKIAYGLKGNHWKTAILIVLLYVGLYFGRSILSYLISGQMDVFVQIVQNPLTWMSMAALFLNYFFTMAAFFGEEYGWRYYFQPALQKKFGMVRGVLILGIVWGLWHLPINFFYYTNPASGIISVTSQLVTCIALGAFYGWAYLKTNNIWAVVIMHFVNNNLVPIITGTYTSDILQNQEVRWMDVLFLLVVNGILFLWVLFTSTYKNAANRLPTMDERADQAAQSLAQQTPATPTTQG